MFLKIIILFIILCPVECIVSEKLEESMSFMNSSNTSLVVSKSNRCNVYPRCLLFKCCSGLAEANPSENSSLILNHHNSTWSDVGHITLEEHIKNIELFNVIITVDLVNKGLSELQPSSQKTYDVLLQKSSNFEIIYLVQGDYKTNLPHWYQNMKNMIYLSYKENISGNLYFPNSSYGYGRTALYLSARLVEIERGKLYNFFVFSDDDANIHAGDFHAWEYQLKSWNPAVAVPALSGKKYGNRFYIDSLNLVDFMVIAYHRESVEMLHPFILEYDNECTVASQIIQLFEISLLYRSHLLVIGNMTLSNSRHRPYPLDCDVPIEQLFEFHKATTPQVLKHCTMDTLQQFYEQFTGGSVVAFPRIKLSSYNLMSSNHQRMYSSQIQNACSNLISWDPADPLCCSLDNMKIHDAGDIAAFPEHGHVSTDKDNNFYITWGSDKFLIPDP